LVHRDRQADLRDIIWRSPSRVCVFVGAVPRLCPETLTRRKRIQERLCKYSAAILQLISARAFAADMTAECGTSIGAIQTKYLCQDWPGNADFDTPPFPGYRSVSFSVFLDFLERSFSTTRRVRTVQKRKPPVVGWRVLHLYPSLSNINIYSCPDVFEPNMRRTSTGDSNAADSGQSIGIV
jgi:hypothetical protein